MKYLQAVLLKQLEANFDVFLIIIKFLIVRIEVGSENNVEPITRGLAARTFKKYGHKIWIKKRTKVYIDKRAVLADTEGAHFLILGMCLG